VASLWPWVHEDFDLPGEGQPRSIRAFVRLVNAENGRKVKEAYCEGKTIIGDMRAPIDGTPQQWHQARARAEYRLRLAPNEMIDAPGVSQTAWQREVIQWPILGGWRAGRPVKSKTNFVVPMAPDTTVFEVADLAKGHTLLDKDVRRKDYVLFDNEDFSVTARWVSDGVPYELQAASLVVRRTDGSVAAEADVTVLDDGWRWFVVDHTLLDPGVYRYILAMTRSDGLDKVLSFGLVTVKPL
jgi:hypothetical protein